MPLPQFAQRISYTTNYEPTHSVSARLSVPELPNFAKSLKSLNIMQVRQLDDNIDRAVVSFMVDDPATLQEVQTYPTTTNQPQFRTDNIILEEVEYIDDVSVLNEFHQLIQNLEVEPIDLEIDINMGDIDIKGLIMSSIYRTITESRIVSPYIMTNYRLMCFLNNNIEKKFRKFYKKETSFEFIVNDDMGDEIIIGGNDDVNGPVFYMFNKGMTKSKLYILPNASSKFKKLVIKRIDKEEQMEETIDVITDDDNIPDFDNDDNVDGDNNLQEFLDELVEEDEHPTGASTSPVNNLDDALDIMEGRESTVFPYTLVEGDNETTISIDEINPGFNLFQITDSVFRRIMTIVCNKSPYKIVTNGKLGAFISASRSFAVAPASGTIENTTYLLGSCMGFGFNIDASMIWDDSRILLYDNENNRIHTIKIEDEGNDLI